ncbi:hypothetical protein [Erythrobacter sp.]|uniref:hypothetical protein n=1 Tax=Erythrobacter sp. TaxID=1042 RepID=UPI001B106D38|nr:hypothetical protein [Erythrobacter sp.]MBO6527833.1 hypothetical protein [Erythrobacter sp.]MBO6531217.1 hypothetical protein [Erythrobacter sp.]
MDRRHFLASTVALACVTGAAPLGAVRAPMRAERAPLREWEIGPVIRGRNYSVGMPLHPEISREGWFFDFPGPRRRDGHVHYVTRRTGPLDGARGLRLRYRIDAQAGTRFVPQEFPDRTALLSLYIQRRGDDWLARRGTQFHRWYSPQDRVVPLEPGEHELTILFAENWISVMGSDHARSPQAFAEALAEAGRVGFTLGSSGGRGHGVYATAPARFTVLEFSVF